MAQDVESESPHVLGHGVVSPVQDGERLCCQDHVDRRARARSEAEVRRGIGETNGAEVPRCAGDGDGILDQRGIDVDRQRLILERAQLCDVDHRLGSDGRSRHPLDDHELFRARRVADEHLEHESIQLRLG